MAHDDDAAAITVDRLSYLNDEARFAKVQMEDPMDYWVVVTAESFGDPAWQWIEKGDSVEIASRCLSNLLEMTPRCQSCVHWAPPLLLHTQAIWINPRRLYILSLLLSRSLDSLPLFFLPPRGHVIQQLAMTPSQFVPFLTWKHFFFSQISPPALFLRGWCNENLSCTCWLLPIVVVVVGALENWPLSLAPPPFLSIYLHCLVRETFLVIYNTPFCLCWWFSGWEKRRGVLFFFFSKARNFGLD